MEKTQYLDIVIVREKLSSGEPIFVAHCTTLGITSQGDCIEDAKKNIKEAIELYLEECPEELDDLEINEPPLFSFVEVKSGKVTSGVRP